VRPAAPGAASRVYTARVRRVALGLGLFAIIVGSEPSALGAVVWPSTVERTSHDLVDQDVAVRRRAAKQLEGLPRASVRRIGVLGLDDPDPEVRIASLRALIDARATGMGGRVVPWLGDSDARVRRAAADALAEAPVADAVPALARVLADPDATVRAAAAKALGSAAFPAAVPPLLGRLDDPEAEVRESVVAALSRLGDRSAVVPLVGKMQDNRPSVRRAVATALGLLGDPRASSALSLSLRDPDEIVRVASLEALGRLHAADAVVNIVPLLEQERRPAVRAAAVRALSEIPSEAAVDALVHALSTDDPSEPSAVRDALAHAGTRASGKLVECLAGQPLVVTGDGCALALGRIGGASAAPAIDAGLRRGVVRPVAALHALASSMDPRALSTVIEFLASDDPLVRRAAMDAADALLDPEEPDGRAVEPLARALDAAHQHGSERAALVALLGKTGSPRAAPALIELARDATDPSIRIAAVRALGWVGRSGQDDVLMHALDDDNPNLRLAAALSLRRIGSASSAGVLLDRLERAADQDREAIALSLRGPMSLSTDRNVIDRMERLARQQAGKDRDLLVEALGAVPGAPGSAALLRLLEDTDAPTRAKIAEALGAHPEAASALRTLVRDPVSRVRANAVWALGAAGGAHDLSVLEPLLTDPEPTVSGNASAALGRVGARGANVTGSLCGALRDERAYTRANALAGLRASRRRCPGGADRALVLQDPSELVRGAAARLLVSVPSDDTAADRATLDRCAAGETNGDVARRCSGAAEPAARPVPVRVYVVPSGAAAPVPDVPFALVRGDGFLRLGTSDRSGAVFELDTPRGLVRLALPSPLVF